MFLLKQDRYNDLPEEICSKIQAKWDEIVASKAKRILYKFNLAKENPDPLKENGSYVWPNLFVLPKASFQYRWKTKDGKSGIAHVAMINNIQIDENGRKTVTYHKIKVPGRSEGRYAIEITEELAIEKFAYMELHPNHIGGMNASTTEPGFFQRVDEVGEAKLSRMRRKVENDAAFAAEEMNDQEVRDFACALAWDESEDIEILRDQVEALAKNAPEYFVKMVDRKTTGYAANIRRAQNAGVITYTPAEKKWSWAHDGKTLATLDHSVENEMMGLVDWLQSSKNGDTVYETLKSAVGKRK